MITSKQRSLIGLAALCAIASTQACGSDDAATSGTAGASQGTAGAHAGASAGVAGAPAGVAGAPAGVAGAPSGVAGTPGGVAGAPAGGAPGTAGGSSTAGAPAGGAGGASAGSGGSSGGSAGKGGGGNAGGGNAAGSGGGSSTATYAAVKTIFMASCGTGQCHNAASNHTNFQQGELYTTLTTAIGTTPMQNACNGSTLMTPGDANSIIVKVINAGGATCKDGTMDSKIPRMPDNCTGNSCLSADKIKTITDWVTAGAPH